MKLRDNKCIINYAILLLGAKLDTTWEFFSEAHKNNQVYSFTFAYWWDFGICFFI